MKGELREFLKDAEKFGFEFDGYDGHGHVRLYNKTTGDRYPTAATPSDCNGRKNALAALRRLSQANLPEVIGESSPGDDVVFLGDDQEPFTTSLVIARESGNQHKNVMEIVRTYLGDFNEVGRVAFETRPFETAGGTQSREIAILDEQASALMVTYLKNTAPIRILKKRLVSGFYEMRQRLTAIETIDLSDPIAEIEAANARSQRAIEIAKTERDARLAAESERDTALEWAAELETPANAYNELVALKSDAKVADAAKILCRDPKISIGQNRLFNFMKGIAWTFRHRDSGRWCAYQTAVDRGWLAEKPGEKYWDMRVSEYRIGDPVILVTPKGLAELHKRLGGSGQLELVES